MEERWQSGEQRPRAASSLALFCGKGACFSRVRWTLWKINRLQLSCWTLTHKTWYTARCCQWGDGKDRAEGRSSMKTYGEDRPIRSSHMYPMKGVSNKSLLCREAGIN